MSKLQNKDIRDLLSVWSDVHVPEERRERVISKIRLESTVSVKESRPKVRRFSWQTTAAAVAGCLIFAGVLTLGPHEMSKLRLGVLPQSNTHTTGSSVLSVHQAIQRAQKALGEGAFPDNSGTRQGFIWEGGPPPGHKIPATLQTEVNISGTNTYVVTFTESWSTKDFRGQNSSPNKTVLSHYWKYEVRPDDVKMIAEGGDFPPQDVM